MNEILGIVNYVREATEPDRDDEMVDEFIEPRTDLRIDAETGEVL